MTSPPLINRPGDKKLPNKPRYHGLRVSREEYLDLEEDGFKYDVIEGVMQMAPSPSFEHGDCQFRLAKIIGSFLDRMPLGKAVTEVDVFLPDGGDPVRPDISLILNEHLPIVKTHIHGTPDLVCEVLSPATRERDLGIKAERYLRCGVKEYWIADPKAQSLQMWYNTGSQWEKVEGAMEFRSKLLPGLLVKASDVFT